MANVELAMKMPASADRTWSVMTGPELVKLLLASYAERVDVEENPDGNVFVTTLGDNAGTVREQIVAVDPVSRSMRYRVLDAGPMPYANYSGEMRVQPSGADACVLSFQCTFIPVDMETEAARSFWLEHNRHVMKTLKDYLRDN